MLSGAVMPNDLSGPEQDFEAAFFEELAEKTASLTPHVAACGEFCAKSHIHTSLRFTTPKAKLPGLKIQLIDDGYKLSGTRGLLRIAASGNLRRWIFADNIDLSFDEEMLAYEPEDELIKKSKVPLWILKGSPDGSVAIKRVWNT
jgi:hypothetical protein